MRMVSHNNEIDKRSSQEIISLSGPYPGQTMWGICWSSSYPDKHFKQDFINQNIKILNPFLIHTFQYIFDFEYSNLSVRSERIQDSQGQVRICWKYFWCLQIFLLGIKIFFRHWPVVTYSHLIYQITSCFLDWWYFWLTPAAAWHYQMKKILIHEFFTH